MTKTEEISIILKRLPEQQEYLHNQISAYWKLYYSQDHLRMYIKSDLKRSQELYTSAQWVFNNLINRLNELINE